MSHKSFFLGALYAWATVVAVASFAGKERVLSFLVRLRWSKWDGPLFTLLGIAAAAVHLIYRNRK